MLAVFGIGAAAILLHVAFVYVLPQLTLERLFWGFQVLIGTFGSASRQPLISFL